jgi:hypothetical protein
MNRQRVVPPLFRGADGLRVSPEREAEIRRMLAENRPRKRKCEGEKYNRYENNGAGGMAPCQKWALPGELFCRWHKENK